MISVVWSERAWGSEIGGSICHLNGLFIELNDTRCLSGEICCLLIRNDSQTYYAVDFCDRILLTALFSEPVSVTKEWGYCANNVVHSYVRNL